MAGEPIPEVIWLSYKRDESNKNGVVHPGSTGGSRGTAVAGGTMGADSTKGECSTRDAGATESTGSECDAGSALPGSTMQSLSQWEKNT